jgi:AcrR family transcriptional regulator
MPVYACLMSSIAAAVRPRRTQAERSASTRAHLLDATIACLDDLGYAGTTTTEIAARAGVSRGAQLHHFPTKAELVIAAVEHLFQRRHDEFVRAIGRLPAGMERAAAAIDLLWSMVSGALFHAYLELTVAARTDPELRVRVAALNDRFVDTVERTFRELFPAPPTPNPLHEVAPAFVFALMDGLALQKIVSDDTDKFTHVLDALKTLAWLIMPRPAS